MKTLTEADVVRIMNEEWDARVHSILESSGAKVDMDDSLLSAGLKVLHKGSGIRYNVVSVGPRDVILVTPEGNDFLVDGETLENEYEIA